MFGVHSDEGFHETIPGSRIKTLCYGAHTLLCEFRQTKGALLPEHSHPYEQTGYLVSGKLRMRIGDSVRELEPGDSWCIPMDVRHKVDVLEDSVLVEVFGPTRTEYIQYLNPANVRE
ncbi:MAG: cupin domain-containing protein [Rectinema sp.]|nr:cupin domain-containing protein [Rectinema sp.]